MYYSSWPNKAFSATAELTGYYLRNLVFTTINNDKYRLPLFHNFVILVVVYDSVIVQISVNIVLEEFPLYALKRQVIREKQRHL